MRFLIPACYPACVRYAGVLGLLSLLISTASSLPHGSTKGLPGDPPNKPSQGSDRLSSDVLKITSNRDRLRYLANHQYFLISKSEAASGAAPPAPVKFDKLSQSYLIVVVRFGGDDEEGSKGLDRQARQGSMLQHRTTQSELVTRADDAAGSNNHDRVPNKLRPDLQRYVPARLRPQPAAKNDDEKGSNKPDQPLPPNPDLSPHLPHRSGPDSQHTVRPEFVASAYIKANVFLLISAEEQSLEITKPYLVRFDNMDVDRLESQQSMKNAYMHTFKADISVVKLWQDNSDEEPFELPQTESMRAVIDGQEFQRRLGRLSIEGKPVLLESFSRSVGLDEFVYGSYPSSQRLAPQSFNSDGTRRGQGQGRRLDGRSRLAGLEHRKPGMDKVLEAKGDDTSELGVESL
ncbi:hypothetical protein EV360DRAFT_75583 [Lentinula raphanica]|nr:hypothetical protein EV360DRAFT_75583 [Lentinula raphanica]